MTADEFGQIDLLVEQNEEYLVPEDYVRKAVAFMVVPCEHCGLAMTFDQACSIQRATPTKVLRALWLFQHVAQQHPKLKWVDDLTEDPLRMMRDARAMTGEEFRKRWGTDRPEL